MATPRLTTDEERLVERYLWVLDFVGRCAQAVDEGHWHYLWDKVLQLQGAVGRLEEELARTNARPKVRAEAVLAGVRHHGRHYRASRLLHPPDVELTVEEVRSIMLQVASADALASDFAGAERLRQHALAIAGRTDVRPESVVRVLAALVSWEARGVG
jgi:hypothetical protein